MKLFHSFFFFILFICINCTGTFPYEGQTINLSFTEKTAFGIYDSLSEASLFSVKGVQAGQNGKIYVADAATLTIKVYSKEGELLDSFGKRGRGPGELISIKGFSLIDSTVFVWDQSLQRLNLFDLKGSFKTSYALKGVASPLDIYSLNESYLVLHADNNYNEPLSKRTLVHIYTSDFSKAVNFLQIKGVDENFEETAGLLQVFPGSIYVKSDTSFLYIPYIYNGNVYQYAKSPSHGWQQTNIYEGLNQQEPVTLIDDDHWRQPDVTHSSVNLSEPRKFIIHNHSRGLFKFQNYYFHFTFCDIGKNRVFGVEVYDEQFQPIGYAPIDSIPITDKPNNLLQWFVFDVDDEGVFYLRELTAEGSHIRLLQVDMKDLNQL